MKVINFIGQPSAGKTAMASGLFWFFKRRHLNVELVTEYTKDALFEKYNFALNDELIVFTEKYKRILRLADQVDFVITDSSLLNSIFYSRAFGDTGHQFFRSVAERFENIYIFVERDYDYIPHGRMTDQKKADDMANIIRQWFLDEGIPFHTVKGNDAGLVDALGWLEEEGIVPRSADASNSFLFNEVLNIDPAD